MYYCKYFGIKELVTPQLYEMFKYNEDVLWRMFHENTLRGVDWLRERYGVMYINTWSLSSSIQNAYGLRTESGIRHFGCQYYSKGSMHSVGGAIDALFANITAQDARKDLELLKYVPYWKRLERGVSWLHADIKEKPGHDGIYLFYP